MSLTGPEISYILLIIPTIFAVVVIIQGLSKMSKQDKDGPIVFGFGVAFVVFVLAAYWLFIK